MTGSWRISEAAAIRPVSLWQIVGRNPRQISARYPGTSGLRLSESIECSFGVYTKQPRAQLLRLSKDPVGRSLIVSGTNGTSRTFFGLGGLPQGFPGEIWPDLLSYSLTGFIDASPLQAGSTHHPFCLKIGQHFCLLYVFVSLDGPV